MCMSMLVHCTTSHSMKHLQCYVCHGMVIQEAVVIGPLLQQQQHEGTLICDILSASVVPWACSSAWSLLDLEPTLYRQQSNSQIQ